jgi:Domain of unknown function (DUF6431)
MIFAVDVDAAGQALRAGLLCCPVCGGRLRLWSPARSRRVHTPTGSSVALTPERGLCRTCTSSHVIVPAWYVPRRAYTVQVIGGVLLGAVNQVPRAALAERLRVPLGTAHDWLRRARRGAAGLIGHVIAMAPGTGRCGPPDHRLTGGDALAAMLDALGRSAAALVRAAATAPVREPEPGRTGIDYLGLLAAQHYRDVCRALHIVDPSHALASLHPWHIANLLTAQRGLLRAG